MSRMKILLVGPGIMPIPNDGWGAVEIVIWQQKRYLERMGHEVDILNKRGWKAALQARPSRYDIVHLHYDELSGFWVRLSRLVGFPLVITTHYGYADSPERWEPYYQKIFNNLLKAPALLVLSPEIAGVFKDRGFKGWIGVLTNGTETGAIRYRSEGNGRALCLGKIESRKKQSTVAALVNRSRSVYCDFIGPIVDNDFKVDGNYTRYLGTWTREQVHSQLSDYSCLVLASDGEAHPLVVLEAMAAGLSVVVTRSAAANLDRTKPWIKILDRCDEALIEGMAAACRENAAHREEIRQYAVTNFDWHTVLANYANLIQEARNVQ